MRKESKIIFDVELLQKNKDNLDALLKRMVKRSKKKMYKILGLITPQERFAIIKASVIMETLIKQREE